MQNTNSVGFMRRVSEFVHRRPVAIIIVVAVLSLFLAPGTLLIKTETGFDTMLSPDADIFADTERYQDQFGNEPIVVLLEGELEHIFTTDNLAILERFEQKYDPAQHKESHLLLGPVTILKQEQVWPGNILSWDDPVLIAGILDETSKSPIAIAMNSLIADDREHVLLNVWPIGNQEHDDSLKMIEDMENFFTEEQNRPNEVDVRVIGDAEMMQTITDEIGNSLSMLLAIAMVVMAVILLLVFRARWNLLSLLIVGIASLWTFGIMGYIGIPLSMGSIAVLPILIGIGIDYSIQFHNRYQEEIIRRNSVFDAIVSSIPKMLPVIGVALVATAIGFVTLFVSDVPMVQQFGVKLAVGVVLSMLLALFALHSILYIRDRKGVSNKVGKTNTVVTRRYEKMLTGLARFSLKYPIPILTIAVLLTVAGAITDRWLPSKLDHEEMMPQNSSSLHDVKDLQEVTGYEGELHFLVEAHDVTTPEIVQWMQTYQNDMIERYGDRIKSVNSLGMIIGEATGGSIPEKDGIEFILDSAPSVYVEQVVTDDRTQANLSFGCKHMPMQDVHELKEDMEAELYPPDGVKVSLAGSLALGAATFQAMVGQRLMMNSLCFSAIFIVLLGIFRSLKRALVTMIPVGMVLSWTSLILFLAQVPLNTMSAVTGVLILGVGTEFIVLLLGRYEEEKQKNGYSPSDAMIVAISQTGRAIITTALTTFGGFAVLIASQFPLISDFGIATTLGVFLCMIASMLVMPPLVVSWDKRTANRLQKEF